ncbi:protein SPMIP2 [Conger conger]|uniref:protein SPMIP2 n=1 Tax=Conger conger TaxID=82655 RepID=UPI002A5AA038|nr:protein SPMIP2 [Conger conger]
MTENALLDRRDMQSFGKRMLFTGPDGIGDYRPRSVHSTRYIGEGPMPQGETGDLNYLCRPATGAPPPKPKQCYVGAVGWGLQYSWALNKRTMESNMQIKLGEFRSALEERTIFTYHNPWQPPPSIIDKLSAGARGRLAWDHDINGEYFLEQYKQSLLNKNKGEDTSESSGSNILEINQYRSF